LLQGIWKNILKSKSTCKLSLNQTQVKHFVKLPSFLSSISHPILYHSWANYRSTGRLSLAEIQPIMSEGYFILCIVVPP